MPLRPSPPKGAEDDPENPNQTSQRNRNLNDPGGDHPAAPKNPTPRGAGSVRERNVCNFEGTYPDTWVFSERSEMRHAQLKRYVSLSSIFLRF
ncbi:uncharacterized protein LOC110457274 isoform X1 [Mizuhopecten yessoensis]|uniref:uncharacterized protein LOC110457274 isoform X1 n=1 Tax=Mizuhopecten yessoensis TaxID=6573 RepID=UPI000B45D620|nr:uncharacterized protein LOC110457274 isoform X1 [Mizuhopecten yessoensis]